MCVRFVHSVYNGSYFHFSMTLTISNIGFNNLQNPMEGGYDNPITSMDELLMKFPFSSCHIWLFKPKIPLKMH